MSASKIKKENETTPGKSPRLAFRHPMGGRKGGGKSVETTRLSQALQTEVEVETVPLEISPLAGTPAQTHGTEHEISIGAEPSPAALSCTP